MRGRGITPGNRAPVRIPGAVAVAQDDIASRGVADDDVELVVGVEVTEQRSGQRERTTGRVDMRRTEPPATGPE